MIQATDNGVWSTRGAERESWLGKGRAKMNAHKSVIASIVILRYFGSLGRLANKLASKSFPIVVVVVGSDETRVTSVSTEPVDLVSVDEVNVLLFEAEIDGKLNTEYVLERPLSRSIRSPGDRIVP
jgi:hypothetical protein